MRQKTDILNGNTNKTFVKYLIPSVSATIMISINYFVDTLCIGQKLGEEGLAALNLSWPITTVLYSLGLLLGVGGGAIYASYMARGETKRAQGVYTGAFSLLIMAALLITVCSLVFLEPLVTVLGGVGEIRQGVTDYVRWVVIFSVSYMGECFFTSFLRNDNAPRLAMAGTLVACSSNIVMDILFIYVLDGGMVGASLATSLAVTATLVLGIFSTFRRKSGLKLRFAQVRIKEITKLLKVGMATFLTEVDGGIVTFVYNTVLIRIAGDGATTAVAVYGIVVNVNTIVLAAINGISNAMQPLVSANSGAGNEKRAKQFMTLAIRWGSAMAILFVLFIELRAELLVNLFLTPDGAFLTEAAKAIRIVGISYLLAAANMILISYFQAVQAIVQAACGSFLRTLILPVTFVICGALALGVNGVWMASICIETCAMAVLLITYYRYRKSRNAAATKEKKGIADGLQI